MLAVASTTGSTKAAVGPYSNNWIVEDALNYLLVKMNRTLMSSVFTYDVEKTLHRLFVDAARQIHLAIQNVKNAYDNSLKLTMGRLDNTSKKNVEQLQEMVEILQNESIKNLLQETGREKEKLFTSLAKQAEQLIDSLPVAGHRPLLTRVTPRYIAIGDTSQEATIQFIGNFVDATKEGYEASLVLDGHTFAPVHSTEKELAFKIPFKLAQMHEFIYRQGELKVQWENGAWYNLWGDKKVSEYKVWLGALPLSPGTITAFYTTTVVHKLESSTKTTIRERQEEIKLTWGNVVTSSHAHYETLSKLVFNAFDETCWDLRGEVLKDKILSTPYLDIEHDDQQSTIKLTPKTPENF